MAGKRRKSALTLSPWDRLYLLSLPLTAIFFLIPSLDWGTNSDDGWYYYEKGLTPWNRILGPLFIPGYLGSRTFIFGEDRPVQQVFFKLMYELGASPTVFHVISWLLVWGSCYLFAWGLIRFLGLAAPLGTGAVGFLACMLWWSPGGQFSAATALVNPWVLGLLGLFWGFFCGSKDSPRRPALAILFGFLACQTLEDAWPILVWSSLWLLLIGAREKPDSGFRRFLPALVPLGLVAAHILIFRSFNPADGNRPEVVAAFSAASIFKVAKYYLLLAFYAVAEPFVSWTGLGPTPAGLGPQPFPYSFALFVAGLFLTVKATSAKSKTDRDHRRWSWLVLSGGLVAIAPYLLVSNRQLFYYALKLNAFVAAFVAFRLFRSRKSVPKKTSSAESRASWLSLAAVAVAGGFAMLGWNYTKFFGQGLMREFHEQVIAIPGARECTGESPCCLEVPNRTWGRHEWMVNWIEGAGKKPRFVTPGMSCARTLKVR